MTHLRGLRLGGAVKARKLLPNHRQTYRVGACACHREAYNRVLGEYLRTARAATPESIIVVIASSDCNCNLWFRNITYLSQSLCHDAQHNPALNPGAKPTP